MAKLTKRQQMIAEKVDREKTYSFEDAVKYTATSFTTRILARIELRNNYDQKD